ncbi:hypothetical protein V7152_05960 [Neobacillus drentensis]|uniref:hypothetical protein n=1 Tax=Neobacillus drentensis TaxID=220684 RepID=UPI00300048A7
MTHGPHGPQDPPGNPPAAPPIQTVTANQGAPGTSAWPVTVTSGTVTMPTHLGRPQPIMNLVMLSSDSGFLFNRILPDGSATPLAVVSDMIPQGQAFIVTDIQYQYFNAPANSNVPFYATIEPQNVTGTQDVAISFSLSDSIGFGGGSLSFTNGLVITQQSNFFIRSDPNFGGQISFVTIQGYFTSI